MHSQNRPSPGARIDEELIGTLSYVFLTLHKHDLGRVANQLNMEYGDLHAYVTGRRTMPVTLLKRITEVTNDKIFMDTVFSGSRLTWAWKENPRVNSGNMVTEFLKVVEEIGGISETLNKSIADGKVTQPERRELTVRINNALLQLQDLMEVVTDTKGE